MYWFFNTYMGLTVFLICILILPVFSTLLHLSPHCSGSECCENKDNSNEDKQEAIYRAGSSQGVSHHNCVWWRSRQAGSGKTHWRVRGRLWLEILGLVSKVGNLKSLPCPDAGPVATKVVGQSYIVICGLACLWIFLPWVTWKSSVLFSRQLPNHA